MFRNEFDVLSTITENTDYALLSVVQKASNIEFLMKLYSTGIDEASVSKGKMHIKESGIFNHIEHSRIARPIQQNSYIDTAYILFPYEKVYTLQEYTTHNRTLTLSDCVKIGIQLLDVLDLVHRRGIIYCNFHPERLFITEDKGICIYDFSSSITDIDYTPIDEEAITGAYPFVAPEQTGFTAFKPDSRSDLYSLGLLLYKLVSGNLPFIKNPATIGDLIDAMLKCELEPIKMVPSFFNEVFIKALRASPDDRYQTATGFRNDLNTVLSILRREINDFVSKPGELDSILVLKMNHPFITRDDEIEILQQSLRCLRNGKPNTVLLYGNSGVGKTAIARHFVRSCKQEKLQTLVIKCNRFTPNQPYSVYRDLIIEFLSGLSKLDHDVKSNFTDSITDGLREYAGIICRIIPEMQTIFGNVTCSEISEKEKESDRISWALLMLFELICKTRQTMVFIDDFQWIDYTSFQTIINSKNQSTPFLSLYTYRVDNIELQYGIHGKSFKEIANQVVQVDPFSVDEIKWYLERVFGELSGLNELVDVLFIQTRGNPFSIRELLDFLVENRLIEKKENGWSFAVSQIDKLPKRYDTFSLIISKIESLENNEKTILQTSALFDGKIDKDILASVLGYEVEYLVKSLKRLEIAGFLHATIHDEFNFIHDKVQETIYSSIDISKRKFLYEKIGEVFEIRAHTDTEYLFNAAEAYLKSSNLNKAIELSFNAGHYAHNKAALNLASRHFRNCLILTEQIMRFNVEPIIPVDEIEIALANILMLSGKNEQALKIFCKHRESKKDTRSLERLELEYKIGCIYINMGDFSQSCSHFYRVLSEIGMKLPTRKIAIVRIIFNLMFMNLTSWFFKKPRPGPPLQFEIVKLKILNKLSYSLYFDDMILCVLPHLQALKIARRVPDCFEKAETYAMHVVPSLQIFLRKRAIKYLDKIKDIGKWLHMKEISALHESYRGLYAYYSGNWNDSKIHLESAIQEYQLMGDIPNQILCLEHMWRIAYMRGELKDALVKMRTTIDMCKQSREKHFLLSTKAAYSLVSYITDKTQSSIVNENEGGDTPFLTATHVHIFHLEYFLQRGEFDEAYKLFTKIIPLIFKKGFNAEYDVSAFSIRCEVLAKELLGRKKGFFKINIVSKKLIYQFLLSALYLFMISRNYPAHRGAFYRAMALFCSVVNVRRLAIHFFEKAIKWYHNLDMKYEEAKTCRDFAVLYDDLNLPGIARDYYDKAYLLFETCNASVEMDKLIELVRVEIAPKKEHTKKTKQILQYENVNQIRFDTLLEVSNSIYELGDITVLMNQILTALIKATGAQYGCIFVKEEDDLKCRMSLDFHGYKIEHKESEHCRSILERAITERQIIVENIDEIQEPEGVEHSRSVLGVPLYRKNEVMGCVYLRNDNLSGLFSDNAIKTAQILSAQASILLENAFLVDRYKLLNRELDLKIKRQTRDIIDKNRQLEDTNVKLVESERLKGILSGTLVHDIKNYAAGIEGNLQYLNRRIGADSKIKRVIDVVSETCLDIINLASNLLDIAKMDEGRLVVKPEIIEFSYLDGLLGKFASNPMFEDKGIKPVIKKPDINFAIDADVYLLERVIQNIFSNAAKYVPTEGCVEVSFQCVNNENLICFFNSGSPIPERDKEILFEKYARIENRQTQYSKGLGLFFCKMVMIAHKGKIWVDTDDTGNTFKLAFPKPLLMSIMESEAV